MMPKLMKSSLKGVGRGRKFPTPAANIHFIKGGSVI